MLRLSSVLLELLPGAGAPAKPQSRRRELHEGAPRDSWASKDGRLFGPDPSPLRRHKAGSYRGEVSSGSPLITWSFLGSPPLGSSGPLSFPC